MSTTDFQADIDADIDPEVVQWVEMLRSPDLNDRLVAAKSLQHLGDEDAIESLVLALEDESPRVQEIAVTALWEIANPVAIAPLLKCLGSAYEEDVRAEALSALKEMISPDDLLTLLDAILIDDENVQINVLILLRKIHDAQALPYVVPFFESESPALREAAVVTLRYLNQVVRCKPALPLAKDDHSEVRRSAILTLGHLSDDEVIPMLCEALSSDDDWQVRRNAAQALDLHTTKTAIPALIKAMADDHWQVRKFTARALQRVPDETAIPALIKALSDEYSDVRRDAAIALGNIGDPAVLPALQQTLDDPDRDVQIFSERAIKGIQSKLGEKANA
ncbi:PBS lyase HEAT-like repeat domain protein [Synechococcus sp. PCC 7335]|uniref:HEAT repeat domain-containing protein n=1 Tax=Synechococcus sp. (strain ATCC 29403 / PCC 7335) TaxID=91464 RepID=UPI00017ED5FF|nr:HEAT repeat domain-containing protein [Synechococcus sp. PCC 7335]EDX84427.1 PBS lyase HEAT-like repeat domain protein [Synechococcus sp. PCC 7335]